MTGRDVKLPTSVDDEIEVFHADVDRDVAELATRLGERITCHRGCADCCVDELTVFEVEALRIRRETGSRLSDAVPHPTGACAFLDEDRTCRIYASRPYVCRTQGLPLRWIDDRDGETVEFRDICPLNDHGEPLETIVETDCWTIGPSEHRLVSIQRKAVAGGADRILLRTLFDELSCRNG